MSPPWARWAAPRSSFGGSRRWLWRWPLSPWRRAAISRPRAPPRRPGSFLELKSSRSDGTAFFVDDPLAVFLEIFAALRRQQVQRQFGRAAQAYALGTDDQRPF